MFLFFGLETEFPPLCKRCYLLFPLKNPLQFVFLDIFCSKIVSFSKFEIGQSTASKVVRVLFQTKEKESPTPSVQNSGNS